MPATEIERAAARLQEEAAVVLRQASLAARLGADLSLAPPEGPELAGEEHDGEELQTGATLPEPECEPLHSLASGASCECGYCEEEGSEDASQLSSVGAAEAEDVLAAGGASAAQEADHFDSEGESGAEDVEDSADAEEWREERETAAELLRLLTQSLFVEELRPAAPSSEAAASRQAEASAAWEEPPHSASAPQEVHGNLLPAGEGQRAEAFSRAEAAMPEVLAPASVEEELVDRAMARQRKALVAAFLKENGYVDARAPKRTLTITKYPIHTAAKQGDASMVQMLLEEGADALQKTSWGKTAVQIAKAKDRRGSHSAVLRALGGA